jgi:hypothetical protein
MNPKTDSKNNSASLRRKKSTNSTPCLETPVGLCLTPLAKLRHTYNANNTHPSNRFIQSLKLTFSPKEAHNAIFMKAKGENSQYILMEIVAHFTYRPRSLPNGLNFGEAAVIYDISCQYFSNVL